MRSFPFQVVVPVKINEVLGGPLDARNKRTLSMNFLQARSLRGFDGTA